MLGLDPLARLVYTIQLNSTKRNTFRTSEGATRESLSGSLASTWSKRLASSSHMEASRFRYKLNKHHKIQQSLCSTSIIMCATELPVFRPGYKSGFHWVVVNVVT